MATRAENRARTLRALSDASIELFAEHGPSVTVEAIAKKAGVARRTVFRHVDSKEELAFIHPVLWLVVFEAALSDANAPLTPRLREASRAIARHIDDDPEPVRRAFATVAEYPELARGYTAVFQRWVDRVAQEVLAAHREDEVDATQRFQARIIGAAVMGMVDAVVREWVFSAPEIAFTDLYDEGFAMLEPLLDQVADRA